MRKISSEKNFGEYTVCFVTLWTSLVGLLLKSRVKHIIYIITIGIKSM